MACHLHSGVYVHDEQLLCVHKRESEGGERERERGRENEYMCLCALMFAHVCKFPCICVSVCFIADFGCSMCLCGEHVLLLKLSTDIRCHALVW